MIKAYLKYRRAILIFYLCSMVFFPLVHFLSNESMTAMGYSMVILTFLLLIWVVIDGALFRQRMLRLKAIRTDITAVNPSFPPHRDAIEEAYREIIDQLYLLLENNRYEIEKLHTEQTDYYTMWVHQIKTPISAMRLALQSSDHDPVVEQELFKIEQYAEMALQYVKLRQLASDTVIREYCLQDIVRDSVRKYATLFIYRKLTVEIDDFDVSVTTDSKWLAFIIEQLLSNSIKYTRQGGVKISAADGELIIRDTGIGIRSEDIERIFDKGYTGYNGRLDKKASGIGLYMAKKVAEQLAIDIRITSEVGAGTTAVLHFPSPLETDTM